MDERPSKARSRLLLFALRALLVVLSIEVPSRLAGAYLAHTGFFYTPPESLRLADYLAYGREPDVGWLPRPEVDAVGARKLPAFPDPATPACITLYGDSFAWSDEVDDEHTWANVLAQRAGCRVTNYGVAGYGTDQAYLHYLHNGFDRTRIAVLGVLAENVIRNVNQYRRLLSHRSALTLKPRFLLDERGELVLVPVPGKGEAEVRAIVSRPEDNLPFDYFVPGGPSGVQRLHFPYSLSLLGLFGDYRIRALLHHRSYYQELLAPDHPSRAVPITAAIARAFRDEAVKRGATPVAVLIPLVDDLRAQRRTGVMPYHGLAEALDRAGITTLDAGPRLAEALAGRDPCALYTRCTLGHFNEEGYRLMGEITQRFLVERGMLAAEPPKAAQDPAR